VVDVSSSSPQAARPTTSMMLAKDTRRQIDR
jgi:hypothetical protein